jgi:hypothetical protein
MSKAPRIKRKALSPFSHAGSATNQMDAEDDIPFRPSVLAGKMETSTSRRPALQHAHEPSPHDGLNQEEAENALLEAMLPKLAKAGLSVRFRGTRLEFEPIVAHAWVPC